VAVLVATVLAGMAPPASAADPPEVVRWAGADRYETAVAISRATYPGGVASQLVFLVTGENYPDALAVGPASARYDAPVLLTRRDRLPAPTVGELGRLAPELVVVLGGTAAVSDAVVDELWELGYPAGRLWGPTRYETAVEVSNLLVADGVATATVAVGTEFADAMTAGAVAAPWDVLLLVERDRVPPATAAELRRLGVERIDLIASTGTITQRLLDELGAIAPVNRVGGATPADTSARASWFYESADVVYLATQSAFPDGLAGGGRAGADVAPLMLTRTDCVTPSVLAEIAHLAPRRVVLLGGTAALSADVAALRACPG
jgi:putative cell wall-binding protein